VRAGWIKVGATDDGLTEAEAKVLRAAAGAAVETGATIGSHTVRGAVARPQLDLIEGEGAPANTFVWIHAHQEPEIAIHHELARRGTWIEYDGIGDPADDDRFIGLVHRALLSQDRGWYDPAQPGGGTPKPYTWLIEGFLPRLAATGVDAATIEQLMRHNPFRAFARP
jgi:phosphotriesterase-related protein